MIKKKQWFIAYKIIKNGITFKDLNYAYPPKDRIWADPFPLKIRNKYFIFFEELVFDHKGHINVMQIDKIGNIISNETVLNEDFHLSYPFIFEEEGEVFLIPETHEINEIRLYSTNNFPFDWKYKSTLIENVDAVDSNLIKFGNKYILTTSIRPSKGGSRNFFVYSSKNLFSGWKKEATFDYNRNAGNFLNISGQVYRPSQNSIDHYGHSIDFNRVYFDSGYTEFKKFHLPPVWSSKLLSTHTFNTYEDLFVIDGQKERLSFSYFINYFTKNLKKRLISKL